MKERLVYSPSEAAELLGIGRTKIYQEIASGSLTSFTLGRRRLVSAEDLHIWIQKRRDGQFHERVLSGE